MYFKLATSNVKKSFKDYTIYFLTLMLAVCIFYSFNSIESQKAMLQLSSGGKGNADALIQGISYISVFISFILGGLILYANNFLIKKRNRELGIYMTLGMGKNKISRILFLETVLIGAISLVAGLILGIVLSQGLSMFTIKLFEVSIKEFKFIISTSAILKTVLYFGIMFLLVMVFNTGVISKYKLIDMLNASRKNESVKIKNTFTSVIIFILSIVMLVFAYYLINKAGLDVYDIKFALSIILGILGTFLFFFSLAGFVMNVIQKNEKIYFKNLNIFVTRQINSKINTNFISMTLICLMLFLTISILSTGLSMKNSLEQGLEASTPFDASAKTFTVDDLKSKTAEELFQAMNYDFKDSEYTFFNEYYIEDIKLVDILGKYADEKVNKIVENSYSTGSIVIKISEYNDIRKLNGKGPIELNDNEVLVTSNVEMYRESLNKFIYNNDSIDINGEKYDVKNTELITDANYTETMKNNILTVIVPNGVVENLTPNTSYININYKGDKKEELEKEFKELFLEFREGTAYDEYDTFMLGYTREQIYEENKGMSTTILYIGIYLGVVFLISSAAVLALQQLSEASDSVDRYKSLKRIGATEKMINKTIFTQTLIYFMVPLTLAIVHSIVGIIVASEFISLYGTSNIGPSAVITLLIIVVIYGGYFYATYAGYKSIVKNNK